MRKFESDQLTFCVKRFSGDACYAFAVSWWETGNFGEFSIHFHNADDPSDTFTLQACDVLGPCTTAASQLWEALKTKEGPADGLRELERFLDYVGLNGPENYKMNGNTERVLGAILALLKGEVPEPHLHRALMNYRFEIERAT